MLYIYTPLSSSLLPGVCLPLSPTHEPEVCSLIQARPQSTRQRFSRGRPATLQALLSTRVLRGASFSLSFVSASPFSFFSRISLFDRLSLFLSHMYILSFIFFASLFFSEFRLIPIEPSFFKKDNTVPLEKRRDFSSTRRLRESEFANQGLFDISPWRKGERKRERAVRAKERDNRKIDLEVRSSRFGACADSSGA